MLCLGRKRGESIVIDCPDGSEIVVSMGRGRLCVEAPGNYRVHRAESRHRGIELGADLPDNIERAANMIGRDIGKPPARVVDERTNPRD
jgi:sRNA-binding carbon storage regulator CsrA